MLFTGGARRRARLLARLDGALRHPRAGGSAGWFDPGLERDAGELVRSAGDSLARDHEVLAIVGGFHWLRAGALPEGPPRRHEVRQAVYLLAPLYAHAPKLVPGGFREWLPFLGTRFAPCELAGGPPRWSGMAEAEMDAFFVGRDPDRARRAAGLFALAAVTSGPRQQSGFATECWLGCAMAAGIVFLLDGRRESADEAVQAARSALTLSPPSGADSRFCRAQLATALLDRHDRFARPEDLDEALGLLEQELAGTADADGGAPEVLLSRALLSRFEGTGDPEDIERVVSMRRRALDQPQEGPGEMGERMSALAAALERRFEYRPDRRDIDEAVELQRAAVDLSGDSVEASEMSTLARLLGARFEWSGDRADIEESIEWHRRALEAPFGDGADHLALLSNLSSALQTSLDRHDGNDKVGPRAPAVAHEAVDLARRALGTTSEEDPDFVGRLGTLANALSLRSRCAGDDEALDEAVVTARRAADAARAAGHPATAMFFVNLGNHLSRRHERTGGPDDLAAAADAFREATRVSGAPVPWRIRAADYLGRCEAEAGNWARAVDAFAQAIDLLPRMAALGVDHADAHTALDERFGLAADAAACSLHCGDAQRAVRLLEAGRGLLLNRALDTRADTEDLRRDAPDLAARWHALTQPIAAQGQAAQDAAVRAEAEWEALMTDIRRLPHPWARRFLQPAAPEELMAAAEQGPLVMLNASRYRSDALIITSQGIRSTPLPLVTRQQLIEQIIRLVEAADDPSPENAEASVTATLRWLWDAVAGPVLDTLDLPRPAETGVWPRLWWIPGGALCHLPVHAAGYRQDPDSDDPRSVVDRVVSSYTPTVRALIEARRIERLSTDGGNRMLVVAMPTTPRAAPLPSAQREAEFLSALFPTTQLKDSDASAASVLEHLPHHGAAHFACHATADAERPADGHLMLTDKLAVRDISRLNLARVRFAYLSACATTVSSPGLADEAVHLSGAFHLAGFTHVVGTLWPIKDDTTMTEGFYESLPQGAHGAPEFHACAQALHTAVLQAREHSPWLSDHWAHVHIGP
ncbi:CHAT domain-containing protein [Streptomyces sp. NPDC058676]|uniref:CHAT domain-containing protein n=1 Tax=unclassified Streptomyces TaxID=2593676 RepID=UPI0036477E24